MSTSQTPRPDQQSNPTMSAQAITALINQTLQQYLAVGKFTGPQGQQGPPGPAGSSIVQNNNGQTTAVIGGNPIVTYVPPVPSQSFSGASVAGFTDLSSNSFTTQTQTISGLLSGSSASLSGSLSVGGSASLATTTTGSLTVTGPATLQGAATIASLSVSGTTQLATSTLSSLTVAGPSTLSSSLLVSGAATFATTTASSLTVSGSSTLQTLTFTFATGTAITLGQLTVNGPAVLGTTTIAQLTVTANSTLATTTITNLTLNQSLAVSNGGTGATSYTTNGVIYAGGSALTSTVVGTNGQLLLGQTGAAPAWATLSGDAIINNSGSLALATVNTNTGTWGSASAIPQFTVNGKGLITAASNVPIAIAANQITSGQLAVAYGGTGTTTLGSLTVGGNLNISGGQTVLIGTSTQISLGANVIASVSTGTSGSVFNVSTSTNALTLNLPFASSVNTGQLQATDWLNFNNKLSGSLSANQIVYATAASSTAGSSSFSWNPAANTLAVTGSTTISNLLTVGGTLAAAGTSTLATTSITSLTVGGNSISGTNSGDVTLSGQNYLSLSGQQLTANLINLTANVIGILPVANGGTGASTLTANDILFGNNTNAIATSSLFTFSTASGLIVNATSTLATTTIASLTVSQAPTFSSLTQGSIPFAGVGGLLSQNNGNLFWNNSNLELGIGTSSPSSTLFIQGSGSLNPFTVASSSGASLLTVTAAGNVGIGTTVVPGTAPLSVFGGSNLNADYNYHTSALGLGATGNTAYGRAYYGYNDLLLTNNADFNGSTLVSNRDDTTIRSTMLELGLDGMSFWVVPPGANPINPGGVDWMTLGYLSMRMQPGTPNNTWSIGNLNADTSTSTWTGNFFVNSATHLVRIGNSDASQSGILFDVHKSSGDVMSRVRTDSGGSAYLQLDGGTNNAEVILNKGATQYWEFGLRSSSDWTLYDNIGHLARVVVQSNTGNVGIGTTLPQQRLALGPASNIAIESASAATGLALATSTGGSLAAATYYIKIVAVDANGNYIGPSSEASIAAQVNNQITVNWNAASGAVSYQIWYSTTTGTENKYFTSATTSYAFTTTSGNSSGTITAGTTSYSLLLNPIGSSYLLGGRVGIGTITPNSLLSVQASSSYASDLFDVATSTGTSYFHITSAGNVGIGTTSPQYLLQVGSASVASNIVARFQNVNGTCDVNPTTGTLACSSDARLKKNITPMADELAKVMDLQPVYFNWNGEANSTPEHPGFIAQQVQQVMPEVVSTDPTTGLLSIGYSDLVPAVVSVMQQMQAEITTLQGGLNGNASSSSLTVYVPSNFSGDSVGEAEIPAGQASVRVYFSQPYAYQPIVTFSPEGAFISAYIAEKDASGFTLAVEAATTTPVTFDWHSFASPSEQLTVSGGTTQPIALMVANSAPVSGSQLTVAPEAADSPSATQTDPSLLATSTPAVLGTSTPASAQDVANSTTTPSSVASSSDSSVVTPTPPPVPTPMPTPTAVPTHSPSPVPSPSPTPSPAPTTPPADAGTSTDAGSGSGS